MASRRLFEDDEGRGYSMSRVLALSDGVFAIALTLLVISVRIGEAVTDPGVSKALRDLRPVLFAYGLSVVVIGAFWVGHHRSFSRIVRVNQPLLWINITYLGLVALIPFPTDLLGRFVHRGDATVIYAIVISAAALVGWSIYAYARHAELLAPGTPSAVSWFVAARSLSLAGVFLASIPIAIASPSLAQKFWILAIPARLVMTRLARRRLEREGGDAAPAEGM